MRSSPPPTLLPLCFSLDLFHSPQNNAHFHSVKNVSNISHLSSWGPLHLKYLPSENSQDCFIFHLSISASVFLLRVYPTTAFNSRSPKFLASFSCFLHAWKSLQCIHLCPFLILLYHSCFLHSVTMSMNSCVVLNSQSTVACLE